MGLTIRKTAGLVVSLFLSLAGPLPGAQTIHIEAHKARLCAAIQPRNSPVLRAAHLIPGLLCAGSSKAHKARLCAAIQPRNSPVLRAARLIPGLLCAGSSNAGFRHVGSKSCAPCHNKIYADYLKTAMGRSLAPADVTKQLVSQFGPVTVQNGKVTYEVSRRGNEVYQAEYQIDESGKLVFKRSYRLEYAIGSGVNGISYAIRRGNYLFQAPLSYYSRTGTWQLSPGYEHDNVGFSRSIAAQCLTCHSGMPQAVANRDGLYSDPPFAEMAIGCENCHGPGGQHIEHPSKGSIVNPARLTARLAGDICMNCHQAGDTRVLEPGKTYSDFKPGTPLSDTLAIFKIPLDPAVGAQSDLLEHNFSMTLSKCYRASGGRLSCLTCHDPHAMPARQTAARYYETKCLGCHSVAGCKLPISERAKETRSCIGCHMPKADLGFISHSALTNHRIVRRADAPLPSVAYKQVTPDLPDLIYLNRSGSTAVPPIMLLQAYGELMSRAPQYREPYLKLLDVLASSSVNDPLLEAALGRRALADPAAQEISSAINHLSRALKLGFTGPGAFEDLANALSKQQRTADAIDVLKQGIELSPYAPRLHKLLTVQYINTGQYDLAKAEMQHYLELFPEDEFMRDLLRKVGA